MNLRTLLNQDEKQAPFGPAPNYGIAEQGMQPSNGGDRSWGNYPPSNGGSRYYSRSLVEEKNNFQSWPIQGAKAALQTIERYKKGEIQNRIPTRFSFEGFPAQPTLYTADIFGLKDDWSSVWKLEQLEKIHPDFFVMEQIYGQEFKITLKDFKQHAKESETIWYAKDIALMHQSSCIISKKNKYCMGCSPFWQFVQSIQEEFKPWGNSDLLHYEPEHTETFLGSVAMSGSFSPQKREMLACDSVHSMVYSDDPQAYAIWGFIAPSELAKLSSEDGLLSHLSDSKSLIDPAYLESRVQVIYAIQRPGETLVIPSMWVHWVVQAPSEGLSFSISWNLLRLQNISEARKCLELNRSLGLYQPLNISSLVISAAYQKLEEMEILENIEQRREICDFVIRILPILRTQALEELLGERVELSALVVITYNMVIEKLKENGRSLNLPSSISHELLQFRDVPLPVLDKDTYDSDEDVHYTCSSCKYILFNSRRSCKQCKGYDLCEACYLTHGKFHNHKMKTHRKTSVFALLELIENLEAIITEFEPIRDKEREREIERETEREKERGEKEPKKKRPRDTRRLPATDKLDKDSREKELKERETREKEKEKDIPKEKEKEKVPEKERERISADSYDEEVIDCICGNNKDLGFMISCEKCYAWLHGKCVGISKRNEPEEYYCPRCVKKQQILNATAKFSPRDLSPQEKLREYQLLS